MSLPVPERDIGRLRDMLDHALIAQAHAEGLDEAGFHASRLHQDAVIRVLAIIGEAANALSEETRAAHPDIPWRSIIGMRHRLVHDYAGVTPAVIWTTVQDRLPILIGLLRAILPPPE